MSEHQSVTGRQRPRKQLITIVGFSLLGVLSLGRDHQPSDGARRLGMVWDTMTPSEQSDICDIIDAQGARAGADQILESTDVDASIDDAKFFAKGLACHIRVGIEAG